MSDGTIEVVAYSTDDDVSSGAEARVFETREEANEHIDELRLRDDVTGFHRQTVSLDEFTDN